MVWDPRLPESPPVRSWALRAAPGCSSGAPGRSGGILGAAGWFLDAPWALLGGCGSTVAPTFFFIVFPSVFLLLFGLRLLISSLLFYLIFGFSLCFLLPLSLSLLVLCVALFRSCAQARTTAPQLHRGGDPQTILTIPCGVGGGRTPIINSNIKSITFSNNISTVSFIRICSCTCKLN